MHDVIPRVLLFRLIREGHAKETEALRQQMKQLEWKMAEHQAKAKEKKGFTVKEKCNMQ
jgi:hypothetical protein